MMAKKKPIPKKTAKPPAKKPVPVVKAKPSSKGKPAAKVPAKPAPQPLTPKEANYQAYKEQQAEISRARSAKGREIGPIPDIANVERREACSKSLKLFCDTYNPDAFSLPWADYQIASLGRIEEAVRYGALYAMAEPRGGGKTTRCRKAALWALSNALCRYVFVIGANAEKAGDTIDALKMYCRYLPLFAADYPEISHAAIALGGIANRASGQTCNERSTLIEWGGDRIVFPTVPPPKNWPKHWPLRGDGMVPTSGAVVSASGLTGDGIRGSLLTLSTGESVRPDLVLIDDPQTNESARSRSQNATRESLISADVLGMAGPGKTISAVMPCTVIEPGDAMDCILDRDKHPMWRGSRTRMLVTMPTNMAAWDDYFEIYRRCALKEPPDFTESNAHYIARRETLDAGAVASWPARHTEAEVSAIQSAMHLYYRNPRAFAAEYQNEPQVATIGSLEDLDAAVVAQRVNKVPRGIVPDSCSQLTCFIDCGQKALWWVVCGWSEKFAGSVVDYGCYPAQTRSYFGADDVRPSLADVFPHLDETARLYAGLKTLTETVLFRGWPRQDGGTMQMGRGLVDSGKWTDTVHAFCERSAYSALLSASKGWYIGPAGAPMANWPAKPGERRGDHWIARARTEKYGRTLLFETNYWKSFVAARLQTPVLGAGGMYLFGDGALRQHQLFADHLTAEYQHVPEGRKAVEWKTRPGRPDNHWWDCLVGNAVAASFAGAKWDSAIAAGETPRPPAARAKRIPLSERIAAKDRERERARELEDLVIGRAG